MGSGKPPTRTVVNLALQGGGAHGAFTWGVLDCLLDQEDIQIGRVCGTSAGALNGAALVSGLRSGGRSAARDNLALLWQRVAQAGLPAMFMLPFRKPGLGTWDDAMPLLSPYQTNPFALEGLRFIVAGVADIDALRTVGPTELFVNAVNVQTGCTRVFGPADMSVEAILASACAPLVFPAVQIDGESYWDGSYGANTSLWPLYQSQLDADLLLVELTPQHRRETPTTAKNILNRINEIASSNGLVTELRALTLVNSNCPGADIRMHVVSLPDSAPALGKEPSVKRSVGPILFEALRRSGYDACFTWLESNRATLGVRSSIDIQTRYLENRLFPVECALP